jgi:histidine triad (HIT) family protein
MWPRAGALLRPHAASLGWECRIVADSTHDPPCVFCRIIRGEIPSARVLETDHAVVLLDINPLNPGHALIVPRAHHAHLGELPADISAHAGSLLPRICRAIKSATGADGINVIINNGRVAGQTIEHCHWHVIPRFDNDRLHWPWPQGKYSGDELIQMKERIGRELGEASRTE